MKFVLRNVLDTGYSCVYGDYGSVYRDEGLAFEANTQKQLMSFISKLQHKRDKEFFRKYEDKLSDDDISNAPSYATCVYYINAEGEEEYVEFPDAFDLF